ncbi:MaoC/PaaZ C-terminal domain-containing protein [Chloroflexota bacterium]
MEVTPLIKHTSKRLSAAWAGVCGDYAEYHYDDTSARESGFPAAVVNGKLLAACLTQLMTNWIGERGILHRIACQYRRLHIVGETLTCMGRVTDKYSKGDQHLVGCEIWIENPKREKGTLGSAIVSLPSRCSSR